MRLRIKYYLVLLVMVSGVLLPYQVRWVKDDSAVKVAEKSRRVGLSWAEAADSTLHASRKKGTDVWYVGYNQDMAREFINDCGKWAKQFNKAASGMEEVIIDDEDKDIISFRITFASGHRVTALSSRPANLRGKKGRIVIDEAAFHDDLPGLTKAAIAFLMWGGKVRIISTHFGEDNPYNDIINEIREGKKKYSLHRITLADALADGLYKRICQVLGEEWSQEKEDAWAEDLRNAYGDDADEELDCIPSKGTGLFFTRVMVEQCMSAEIPVIRWACTTEFTTQTEKDRIFAAEKFCKDELLPLLDELPKNKIHYFGEDFGRTGDKTVITPLTEATNLTYKTPFQLELHNVPFKQQEQILFYIVDRLPNFRHGALDARGNGQYLAEVAMQRYGVGKITQVMLTVEWYRSNMPPYKAGLEDKSIVIAKHSDVLADHAVVKMKKGVATIPDNGRTKGSDGKQRHGDSVVALVLAWFSKGQEGMVIESEAAEETPEAVNAGAPPGWMESSNPGRGF